MCRNKYWKLLTIRIPQKIRKFFSNKNDNLRITQDRYSSLLWAMVHEQNSLRSGGNKKPISMALWKKISLKPADVGGIVFWSRNLAPMVSDFSTLYDTQATALYFQLTLIGYPDYIDPGSPKIEVAAKTAKTLRNIFGPQSVVWRYDPIALTSGTDALWHRENFASILKLMEGVTDTCVISFIDSYKKMERNYFSLLKTRGVEFYDPVPEELVLLADELYKMAAEKNITVTACCEPLFTGSSLIKKAVCIDIERLGDIKGTDFGGVPKRSTRPGCGCYLSKDIGAYDTCISGCAYCYATRSRETAIKNRIRIKTKSVSLTREKTEKI